MADPKRKLRFTNGYDIDLVQIARLVGCIADNGKASISKKMLLETLGLPDRQVTCLLGVAEGMGLLNARSLKLTHFGESLRDFDPYLSQPLLPWLLHYNLGSNPSLIIWFRMTNQLITPGSTISVPEAKSAFSDLYGSYADASVTSYLGKELNSFCRSYSKGAFARLAYLEPHDDVYVAPSMLRVPHTAFAYALLFFSSSYRYGETAISIDDIANAPSSPGRIFLMREPEVRAHLERMHRSGVISIENKGHLDQVRIVNPPHPADYLLAHFEDTEE